MISADLSIAAYKAEKIRNRIVLIPGSFDPITIGHIDVVERTAKLFDEVVVAILVNPEKLSTAMFNFEQRKRIATVAISHIPNARVITFEGMLWRLAQMLGASAIVKGIRNAEDLEYEQKMAIYNHEHYPDAETLYIPSYDLADVSSTRLRAAISDGTLPKELVTPELESILKIVLSEKDIFIQ